MNTTTKSHIVFWRIRCVNRQTKTMFDRDLVLNDEAIADADRQKLISIVSKNCSSPELLQFRPSFKECSDDDFQNLIANCEKSSSIFIPHYFEDEAGTALGQVGLTQILTDETDPVIGGNIFSVTRLGACSIKDKQNWTVDKANDIAHYLDLCRRLANKRWFNEEMRLQTSPTVTLIFPDADATDSALLTIRQFFERRDDSFNQACKHYVEHASDGRKIAWVRHEQDKFKALQSTACVPDLGGMSNKEVLELYAYGALRIHRCPNSKHLPQEFAQAVANYGRERVMFGVGAACKLMLSPALCAAPAIAQDYKYWVENEGCCDSTQNPLPQLFGNI